MSQYLPTFVIAYSDSSFTNPHEAALPDDPPECTGNFTHMGAKYWGFETERHRATHVNPEEERFEFNHDAYHWLHLGLTQPAEVARINISTKWFTGNQVQEVAVDLKTGNDWREVIARTPLAPDQEHTFELAGNTEAAIECRLRCYHEGGIARVSLFGTVKQAAPDRPNLLAGATISHVSNEHYGKPADAVAGARGIDYMFGWESARTGFGEHALFHLEKPAIISELIVDTYLHRLNPPLACHLFGLEPAAAADLEAAWLRRPKYKIGFADGTELIPDQFHHYMSTKQYLNEPVTEPGQFSISLTNPYSDAWHPLVPFGALRADTWHQFKDISFQQPVSHVLYMHYPNGGIHGLKLYGDVPE